MLIRIISRKKTSLTIKTNTLRKVVILSIIRRAFKISMSSKIRFTRSARSIQPKNNRLIRLPLSLSNTSIISLYTLTISIVEIGIINSHLSRILIILQFGLNIITLPTTWQFPPNDVSRRLTLQNIRRCLLRRTLSTPPVYKFLPLCLHCSKHNSRREINVYMKMWTLSSRAYFKTDRDVSSIRTLR